jgi:hypothetical protein
VIHGAVGFGMNLLAVPVLVVLDPNLVPGPAVAVGLVLSALVAAPIPTAGLDRRLGWAVAGLLPGTGLALLLARVPADAVTVPLGVAVLVAVLLSVVRLHLSATRLTLAVAEVASGLHSTAASIGEPPMALVYARSDAAAMRANLNGFFVVTAAVSPVALTGSGKFRHARAPPRAGPPARGAARLRDLRSRAAVAGPWTHAPGSAGLSAVAGAGAVVDGLVGSG